MQNTDATIPDSVFTRTGVPSLRLNTPKNPGKAPSYAATAWIRSEPIIQTAPEVISVKMKPSEANTKSVSAAPP